MGLPEIILIGLALSMDAFAVTISNSFVYHREAKSRLAMMPVFFGVFQGLMPAAGYLLGSFAASIIEKYAGIVSLVILCYIGGSMVREAIIEMRKPDSPDGEADATSETPRRLTVPMLLAQAVATSIDAFAVGITLLASGANIMVASPVIALTTLVLCAIALVVGRRFGMLLGDRAQLIGGLVLIAIGIHALFS